MATQTYTVKSGDTLSGIAKNAGVGVGDITGYKSGNANLILPGEVLTINPTQKSTTPANNAAQGYSSAVKDALTGTKSSSSSAPAGDDYLTTLKTTIDSARKTVSDAATQLAGLKTKAYNDEYAASGLADTKTKIASLDDSIAAKKAERDAAVAKVRSNPGLSAALLTGTVSKLTDKYNADINNDIQTRNTLAGTYNTGLTEIGNKVNAKVGDAQTAYDTANKALESLTGQAKDYQSTLVDTLKNADTKAYQDQSLAIQLMNAQTAAEKAANGGDTSWKLAISPLTGKPIYWYNSSGQTKPLTAADLAAATGAAPADTTAPASDTSVETPATNDAPWYAKLLSSLNPFK